MSTTLPTFDAFFRSLWDREPFPWQTMLAERVAQGNWPQVLDLPTAAGKTACMDIAIYALACQAELPVEQRTAPRRIWFVVDRRIVVDAAYDRAEIIAQKLRDAKDGPLKEAANRLKRISGTDIPLAFARLRGGVLRDDGWARLPSQSAVITSTVDQLGSRLLFRGYGHGERTASIFAGLAAHDSLILLDEAHCSVPFRQTLRNIALYRGEKWAEAPLKTPFAFAALSATPGEEDSSVEMFPGENREAALAHPVLQKRLTAGKQAELVGPLKAPKNSDKDPLIEEAVRRVVEFRKTGKKRMAVIVNRVRTAAELAAALKQTEDELDIVLLTGRLRPFERDRIVEAWERVLRAGDPEEPRKPVCLVATQCIEVGADFSFDALVTECAALDALRQRFGRLDRLGNLVDSESAILIRELDHKKGRDPVYGEALVNTWNFLSEKATTIGEGKKQKKVVDFGFEALNTLLGEVEAEDLGKCLTPKSDAPVLFPAYLDLFCQTSPTPYPEPDVPLFLHGKDRGAPEVRVVWRADLAPGLLSIWKETVALCPPVSGEMLSVPLYRLRQWLSDRSVADDGADIEGAVSGEEEKPQRGTPCLQWRGRGQSCVIMDPSEIRPNDVVVLPAEYGIEGLGQPAVVEGFGTRGLDLWERALGPAGKQPALRLNRDVLGPWTANPELKKLLDLVQTLDRETADAEWEKEEVRTALVALADGSGATEDSSPLPDWLKRLFQSIRAVRKIEAHPGGGAIVWGEKPERPDEEPDLFADEDDLMSTLTPKGKPVSLEDHSRSVRLAAEKFADRCLPSEFLEWIKTAAYWHDVGKLDERFQFLLRNGGEENSDWPLAKSADMPKSPYRRQFLYESSGLPENFRHEMLSVQLAERFCGIEESKEAADLVLHLIASHHGHARPFAPVCDDKEPPPVTGRLGNVSLELSAPERQTFLPYRIDSAIPERFWRLTRRYGWWGLAYLEAVLRLADWYGSVRLVQEREGREA